MEKRFDRIDDKLDRLTGKLEEINLTLGKQHESLVHHVKRTDLLEESLNKNTLEVVELTKTHNEIVGVGKFFTFISVLGAIGTALFKLLH